MSYNTSGKFKRLAVVVLLLRNVLIPAEKESPSGLIFGSAVASIKLLGHEPEPEPASY